MADTRTLAQRFSEAWRAYWSPPLNTRDPALAAYFGSAPTASGESVNEATALNFSAVWAAVNRIAGSIASLPLIHYKRLAGGGKDRYVDSRLYAVLHDAFNPEMPAMTARETMTGHVLTWGNAYAEIQRNEANQVMALWPLEPNRVAPYRETPTGPLRYRVTNEAGRQVTVPAETIFHLKGLSFDGIRGYSVIAKARESIGAGLAAEHFTSSFYANGVVFSGTFEHPKTLSETAHTHLTESIAAGHRGAAKAGGFRILEEGMTFKPGGMPLKDAEFLETRKFQIAEIARWFGIPPHMLGDLERATFSNIEQQAIEFVVYTLRPWLVRWEQEIQQKLIPLLERRQQFAEHLVDGLLRGDIQSRYAAYAVGRNGGWLSGNDIREFENQNPIPGGEVYLVQGAMIPLDRINDVVDAQVRPTPTPEPAPAADEPDEDRSARVEAIVTDLQAEMMRRRADPIDLSGLATVEGVEAMRATLVGAVAEVTGAVEGMRSDVARIPVDPSPPSEPVEPTDLSPVLGRLDALERLIATARAETVAEITARLATDQVLREWQDATIVLIAGKLARRELALIKKLGADPDRATDRLAAFYTRFQADAVTEFRPWLVRFGSNVPAAEAAVAERLTEWVTEGRAQCESALVDGTLSDVIRRWEIERAPLLCRRVMEALHGPPV